jgi:hypothetical protein
VTLYVPEQYAGAVQFIVKVVVVYKGLEVNPVVRSLVARIAPVSVLVHEVAPVEVQVILVVPLELTVDGVAYTVTVITAFALEIGINITPNKNKTTIKNLLNILFIFYKKYIDLLNTVYCTINTISCKIYQQLKGKTKKPSSRNDDGLYLLLYSH